MGDHIDTFEEKRGDVHATLQTLAQQIQQQSLVLSEVRKQIGQKGVTLGSENSVSDPPQGEPRLSGKKVKLMLFEGEDPVAWITHA